MKDERGAAAAADLSAREHGRQEAGPLAAELAARLGGPPNGHAPSVDHDHAVGILRQLRGTVDAVGWRRLLERYGVSESELEAAG